MIHFTSARNCYDCYTASDLAETGKGQLRKRNNHPNGSRES